MDYNALYAGKTVNAPEYAGFFRRLAAFLIDAAIGAMLLMLLAPLIGITFARVDSGALDGFMWLYLLLCIFYGALMESSKLQGTLGKLILGIKVTNVEGERLSFLGALGRSGIKLGSVLFMGIGCLVAAFTQQRQALHDFAAHSVVVRKGKATAEAGYSPAAQQAAPAQQTIPAAQAIPAGQAQAPQAAAGNVLATWDTQGAAVQGLLPQELPEVTSEFHKVLYAKLAAAGMPMSNLGSANSIHILGHFILLDGGKRAQRYFTNGLAGRARLEAEGAVVINGVRLTALYAKSATGLAFQVFGGENKRMLKLSAASCAGQISHQAIQALLALRKETPA
jgi:uncharacterized RDD family membrane protein YckC